MDRHAGVNISTRHERIPFEANDDQFLSNFSRSEAVHSFIGRLLHGDQRSMASKLLSFEIPRLLGRRLT